MNRLLAGAKEWFRIVVSERVGLYGARRALRDAHSEHCIGTADPAALRAARSAVLGTGGRNRYTPAPSPSRFIILFSQSDT